MQKVDEFCSEPNELTGFPPSNEKIEAWKQKLKDNGVEEGSPVRLIGGLDSGKIVNFSYADTYTNDCGIGSTKNLGWFYRESDDACVYPIYTKTIGYMELAQSEVDNLLESSVAIGFKVSVNGSLKNLPFMFNILGENFTKNCEDNICETDFTDDFSDDDIHEDAVYTFKHLGDFYAWLEQNY
jgi:hypothetical protein